MDTSQPNLPSEVDTSLLSGSMPVTDQAPVNSPSQETTPQPLEATAGEPSASVPVDGGGAGGGVDTETQKEIDPLAAYKADKAAFLKEAPKAPEVVQPVEEVPESVVTQIEPPLAPDRLPKMPIRPADAQDQALLADWKSQGNGKTLREFILERMQPAPKTESGTPPPVVTLPDGSEARTNFSSLEEIDLAIQAAEDAEDTAQEGFDPKTARAYRREQDRLKALKATYAIAEQTVASVEQTAFVQTWTESLTKAQSIFPEAGKQGSALENKAVEIRQKWVAENHPLAHSADSAVALYAEAQAALGTPVYSAAPVSVSTPPLTPPRPPAHIIAGGAARTTTSRAPVEVTPDNYLEQKARMLGRPLQRT